MQATFIGNIADAVSDEMLRVLPYAEEGVVRDAVRRYLPDCGVVVEAQKEELQGNEALGDWLYNDVEIKVKGMANA